MRVSSVRGAFVATLLPAGERPEPTNSGGGPSRGRRRAGNYARGERANFAKLDADRVRRMRALYADGWTIYDLAGEFGVSPMTALQVVRRKTWRHVEGTVLPPRPEVVDEPGTAHESAPDSLVSTRPPTFEVRSATPDPAADDPTDPIEGLFRCAFARTGSGRGAVFVNYGGVGVGRTPAVFDSLEAALAAIVRTVGYWRAHDEIRHRRSVWPYVRNRYTWDALQAFPLHREERDFVVVAHGGGQGALPRVVWPEPVAAPGGERA